MANSQNGWPIVPDSNAGRKLLTDLDLPGTMPHPVRVLSGDVAAIAQWHVSEYHKRVEPIKPAGCWGWNVRKIGNGPDWSNHSSATAWDLNAPDNPDGAPPKKVMTDRQIAECHKLEAESDGVLRWGGDWSDPDPMHWEIVEDPEPVHAFALTLRPKRTVKMFEISGKLPELKQGDVDPIADKAPYHVTRLQRMLKGWGYGVTPDGEYGKLTAAAVKEWATESQKLSGVNGKTMTLDLWRRLYGIW